MKNRFYVTTPLYYVNAKPHVGTLYSTLLADVAARWHRFCDDEVFFLTGTDEHGQKIAQRAAQEDMEPKAFVDSMIPAFEDAWKQYQISYDHFIRTTDAAHKQTVTHWIDKLIEKGDIYKARYEGLYCVPCETFVTTEQALEVEEQRLCPSCERSLETVSEENYFFRLSAYQEQLLAFYGANPDFITPKERTKEVISFVQSGLKDLSMSRTTVEWGISFPGDSEHTVYVWGDALMNYMSALGYLQPGADEAFHKFWPASLQVMAKDIVKFHAVYFPAFLMAAGVQPAQRLLVHGYLLVDDAKMSKSKGNAFDPAELADQFGIDQVRYYLTRHMVTGRDGNLSIGDMAQRIGSDLANSLGNLLQRTASLALKNGAAHVLPPAQWDEAAAALHEQCGQMLKKFEALMNDAQFSQAYAQVWKFIGAVNGYFHEQEPWKVAKVDKEKFSQIIAAACQSLYTVAHIIAPVMPYKAQQLLAALGHMMPAAKHAIWANSWRTTCTLFAPKEPLFVRPEVPEEAKPVCDSEKSKKEVAKPEAKLVEKSAAVAVDGDSFISIDVLAQVELVVGVITACEPMPKSKKLLRMQVDLGSYGQRQILAGIANFFEVDALLGKRGLFVANLPPRKMMGTESQGMMLLAKDSDNASLVSVSDAIAPGTRLS